MVLVGVGILGTVQIGDGDGDGIMDMVGMVDGTMALGGIIRTEITGTETIGVETAGTITIITLQMVEEMLPIEAQMGFIATITEEIAIQMMQIEVPLIDRLFLISTTEE